MSKRFRAQRLSTAVAAAIGILLAPGVQAQQQMQRQPQQQAQPSDQPPDLQQMWQMRRLQMRARIAGAAQQLRSACGEELRKFCSTVTPGQGRLLLCMQAHQDKIGRPCELALLETSRSIGSAVRRVEDIAEACWQDIQAHCSGRGGSVTQCMIDNRASLSPECRAVVAAAVPGNIRQDQAQRQKQKQASIIGMPIYSADGMMLGQVTGLKHRGDGSLDAVEAELGRPLGLGTLNVLITPGELRWRGDGVALTMVADQVRSVLQGQRQKQQR